MALHASIQLTYADYLRFPADGNRHEILDGGHHVTPAPDLKHQTVSVRLTATLHPFVTGNRLGEIFAAPTDVLLSRHDILQPDLVFVSSQRSNILTERNIQGAPDLVVEILSDFTRSVDDGKKLRLYERFGAQEYWLVDPLRRTVMVYRRSGMRFRQSGFLRAENGDVLTTPLLPGLKLRLEEILA